MIHGTHKNNKIGGDKHDRNISFAVFRAYVSACFSFCFSNNACYSRLNTNPYLWWYRGWGIGRSSCASESHKNRQSLLIAIATVLVLTFSLTYVSHAVAPAAWVIAKKALGSFTLHGKKYNFTVMDKLVPAKAASKMNRTSVAAPRISVSIRQALGIAGTDAGIGYLVYDYSIPHQQYVAAAPVFTNGSLLMDPITVNVGGRNVTVWMVHRGGYGSASVCVNRGRVYIHAGGHAGNFHVVNSTPGMCGPGRMIDIFVNNRNTGHWPGPVNGGLPSVELVYAGVTVVVSPQLLQRPAIEDWAVANPQHFSEANTRPALSPSPVGHVLPPEYARDVSVSVSPESPAPSPTPAPAPSPVASPQPVPTTEPDQFIHPGLPAIPELETSIAPPELKPIPTLLERWISGIPFISFFGRLGLSAGGSCALSYNMGMFGSGSLDFCRYAGIFSVAGNMVLAFAGIYAVYIIFKRGD